MPLEPDRDQIEIFVQALFRYAEARGFVSVRSFYEDDEEEPVFRITPAELSGGLGFVVDVAVDDARRAAQAPKPVVFCPPIAVFVKGNNAKEANIAQGLVLTIDCDQHPQEARAKLEKILGPPTVLVASGGKWTNGDNQAEDKLHLHWRLKTPVIEHEGLRKLKSTRNIATKLVGGDPSGQSVVHPFRWPGSWHRKGEPILCHIKAIDPDREIDLNATYEKLVAIAPSRPKNGQGPGASNTDWADLVRGIISGKTYHPAIIPLSAKLVTAGLHKGAAVNVLRALMESSAGPHDERWKARYAKIPSDVDSAQEKFGPADDSAQARKKDWTQQERAPEQEAALPLPFINMANWDNESVPEYEWSVPDRYPLRQTVLSTGEGAVGKSIVKLQLAVAHVLGRDWLGTMPEPGAAMFVDAEDDPEVLHNRLAAILKHYGVTFADAIKGGLHLISLAGHDAVLAAPGRNGKIEPTPLYKQLFQAAGDIKPKMIGIASSADVFAGSEIDRAQVRQFINLLTRIAIIANGTVSLIAHPSLTGINTGTGLSGNTAWHNSVRARDYMTSVKPEDGQQPDTDLREISFKKNNYGPVSASIVLRYQNGLFLPMPGMSSLERVTQEAKVDDVFLDLLRRFAAANRSVRDGTGTNYAPALFAREEEAKRASINSAALADAMRRLFKAGKIRNEAYSRLGHEAVRLVATP